MTNNVYGHDTLYGFIEAIEPIFKYHKNTRFDDLKHDLLLLKFSDHILISLTAITCYNVNYM